MLIHRLGPTLVVLAVTALLWVALAAAPPVWLDLGTPGDTRYLGGFYDAEVGDGTAFRWSGPDARLNLHGAAPSSARLELRLSGEYLVAQGAPELALTRGAATFAAFAVTPGWRVYRVLLPPGALATRAGEALPLSLRTAVNRPGAGESARDYRALGVPLDWVRVAALGAPTDRLPRALGLAWLAGLLGLGAVLVPTLQRFSAPALVAGLALALWAWRDPQGLAWTLPPAPWTLGVASAGMAWRWASRTAAAGKAFAEPALAAALLLLGVGVALMHTQAAIGIGVGLAFAALLLMAFARNQEWPEAGDVPAVGARRSVVAGASSPWRIALVLVVIVVVALGLRFFRLADLPFGLWRDEARHGLVALRIAQDPGYRPIYVLDERVHLPALGLYPFAVVVQLFGTHMWSLRTATALAGALTVLPLYGVAARLSGRSAVGLGAAGLLAASSWHISISRLAFPTIFEPLLSLAAWWLLLVGLGLPPPGPRLPARDSRLLAPLAGLLAGVLLGMAAQTYHTGRVTPLAAGLLALLLLGRDRGGWRRWLMVVGAAALGFALTVAPLVAYALERPADFNDRVGDVFLLGEAALRGRAPLTALDANLGRHLLMFTAVGDANGRHHAPLRPLLDIVTGMGLLLGVATLLRNLGDWRARFVLGALAVGMLPGLLAVDAPHAMRTFGTLVPVYLAAALGWAWALRQGSAGARRAALTAPALALMITGVLALNAWLYFGIMPRDPQVFAGFYPVQSQMGVYAGASSGGPLYVPREVREHPSFAFLATGTTVEPFDVDVELQEGSVDRPPPPGATFLLSGYFPREEAAALGAFLGSDPTPEAEGPLFPDGRGPTFYRYRTP